MSEEDKVTAGVQKLFEDPQAVSQLFASYLALPSEAERRALAAAHPHIFVPELLDSLAEAQRELHQTLSEVRDVYSTIDSVADVLSLSSFTPVQNAERVAGAEDLTAEFAARFAAGLSALRDSSVSATRHTSALAPIPAAALPKTLSSTSAPARVPWHQQAELVLEVLSYVPARDVLLHAEDVCEAWRYWLFVPEVSRFFWIGVVQREFPAFLQQLLMLQASKEDAVLDQDWRSMAMLCVAQEEDEENENENEKKRESD